MYVCELVASLLKKEINENASDFPNYSHYGYEFREYSNFGHLRS